MKRQYQISNPKNLIFKYLGFLLIFYIFALIFAPNAFAAPQPVSGGRPVQVNINKVQNEIPAQFRSLPSIIAKIFNTTILAAGGIFVIMLLFGGVEYLTGAGNEESTAKGKKRMIDAVIGIIITLSAWAIGVFILNQFYEGTAATPEGAAIVTRQGAAVATNTLDLGSRITPPGAIISNNAQRKTFTNIVSALEAESNRTLTSQQQTQLAEAFASGDTAKIATAIDKISKKFGLDKNKINAMKIVAGAILHNTGRQNNKSKEGAAATEQDAFNQDAADARDCKFNNPYEDDSNPKLKESYKKGHEAVVVFYPATGCQSAENNDNAAALQDAYNLGATDGARCYFNNIFEGGTPLHESYNEGYNVIFAELCQTAASDMTETTSSAVTPTDGTPIDTEKVDKSSEIVPPSETASGQGTINGEQCLAASLGTTTCDDTNEFYTPPANSDALVTAAYNQAFAAAATSSEPSTPIPDEPTTTDSSSTNNGTSTTTETTTNE